MATWKRREIVSRTFTSTGQASSFFVGTFKALIIWVHVTAVSGTTPTLDLRIDLADDEDPPANFVDSGEAFPTITTTGHYFKKYTTWFGGHIRLYATVGGTNPSFTVTIAVEGIE